MSEKRTQRHLYLGFSGSRLSPPHPPLPCPPPSLLSSPLLLRRALLREGGGGREEDLLRRTINDKRFIILSLLRKEGPEGWRKSKGRGVERWWRGGVPGEELRKDGGWRFNPFQ